MSESSFDIVVIGGGPGGYVAAIRAAQLGFKTACIEGRGALGGTCLNVGCIPSKALLESSEMFAKMKHHATDYGLKIDKLSADIAAMLKRKDGIVKRLTQGVEGLFRKNKVTYLKGWGRFKSANTVDVLDDKGTIADSVRATKAVIIATGSVPVELGIAKFDGKAIVSSTEALDFNNVPKHLIVIGGGVIGLEMGSVWHRLGAEVTILEAAPRLLATMDPDLGAAATKILSAEGLKFLLNTKVESVTKSGKACIVKAKDAGGSPVEVTGDRVLVAVGRRAYTDGLGLENIGLATTPQGKIPVDDHFATTVAGVYAIGDVISGPMLAHKAEEEGVACIELIAGKHGHVNYRAIPNIIYTWPEIASVGLSEDECKSQGFGYNIGQFPFKANGRAMCLGTTDGFVKIIADKETDEILGVHMIGPNVSELVAEMAVAIEFKASAEDIARSVHAHPTLSEVVKEAALAVEKRAIHI